MSTKKMDKSDLPFGSVWLSRIGLALGLAILVGFASCGGPQGIQIGLILPLTGGAAPLGKPSQNGMQLALEEYNSTRKSGEPAIEYTVEDDGAQPATAVSAFQKLVSAQHIRLLLGPLTSGTTLAVAPLAERDKVILISPGASAPAVTTAGDYIFRDELSEAVGARSQAELGYSRLGYRSVALLYVNNEYGTGTATIFQKRFLELGGRVVANEAFLPGTSDFRTALEKIKLAGPDAIVVVFQDSIVNIVRQIAELKISAHIFTTPVFEDPTTVQTLGPLAEGIIYTYYGTFNVGDPSSRRFVIAYQQRFQEPPTYYAALGYDAANMMFLALRSSHFNEDNTRDGLLAIRNFPGVSGTMSFDKNGDVIKPVSLKIVRRGQFVPY
jgi:branched-chain amino acid transport system substrate-binding protein